MTVKILIKRTVPSDKIVELNSQLKQLRSHTLDQPGYIYGETLRRKDSPGESLVISTWRSFEYWDAWLKNPDRITIQQNIDRLLGERTEYTVYEI